MVMFFQSVGEDQNIIHIIRIQTAYFLLCWGPSTPAACVSEKSCRGIGRHHPKFLEDLRESRVASSLGNLGAPRLANQGQVKYWEILGSYPIDPQKSIQIWWALSGFWQEPPTGLAHGLCDGWITPFPASFSTAERLPLVLWRVSS